MNEKTAGSIRASLCHQPTLGIVASVYSLVQRGLTLGWISSFRVSNGDRDAYCDSCRCNGTILSAELTDNYRIRPVPATFVTLFDTIN
jgi:hypothetical protein